MVSPVRYCIVPRNPAAHLDESHAFFNGSSVFLLPAGFEDVACEVEIVQPDGERYLNWQVATALGQTQALARPAGQKDAEAPVNTGVSIAKQFGRFSANSYDKLIDHPMEMGTFTHATFEVCGVRHHIAITGKHRADMNRLCADLCVDNAGCAD